MSSHEDILEGIRNANMWGDIRRLVEKDPYIKEQLDKIIVYYRLKYEQRRR